MDHWKPLLATLAEGDNNSDSVKYTGLFVKRTINVPLLEKQSASETFLLNEPELAPHTYPKPSQQCCNFLHIQSRRHLRFKKSKWKKKWYISSSLLMAWNGLTSMQFGGYIAAPNQHLGIDLITSCDFHCMATSFTSYGFHNSENSLFVLKVRALPQLCWNVCKHLFSFTCSGKTCFDHLKLNSTRTGNLDPSRCFGQQASNSLTLVMLAELLGQWWWTFWARVPKLQHKINLFISKCQYCN